MDLFKDGSDTSTRRILTEQDIKQIDVQHLTSTVVKLPEGWKCHKSLQTKLNFNDQLYP